MVWHDLRQGVEGSRKAAAVSGRSEAESCNARPGGVANRLIASRKKCRTGAACPMPRHCPLIRFRGIGHKSLIKWAGSADNP